MGTEHDEPKPPVARCARDTCTSMLNFWKDYSGQWVCGCDSCEDGEYDERGHHRTDPTGAGDTPWEALEYYANVHFGLDPKELIVTEPHV